MLLYCCTISRTLPHSTTSMDGWKVRLPINATIIRLNGTLLTSFLTELKKNCSDDLIIFIVGAKADLQKHRKVTSDLARLRLHEWFPPPKPPTPPPPPPPQPSTFSYMRPRFTSFTSIRSVPLSSPPPQKSSLSPSRDTDDSGDSSLSSVLSRSSTSPHYTRPRAKSGSLLQPSRIHDSSFARSSSRLESRFGYGATGYSAVADSNDDQPEEDDDEDEDSQDSWGLSRGMELFEVSAKDDVGSY